MAAVALQPFNTISLAADTPTQLVASVAAHWYIQVLNLGPGQVGVGKDDTVAAGGATSFTLGANVSYTGAPVWGPDGVWVSASAAGQISVALIPLQGEGWAPPPSGIIQSSGGGGGSQTPWTSNIDAAGFSLTGLSQITAFQAGLTIATPSDNVTIGGSFLVLNVNNSLRITTNSGVIITGLATAPGAAGSGVVWVDAASENALKLS